MANDGVFERDMRERAARNAWKLEEQGRATAAELSDDPAEAEAQAGEWLAGQEELRPMPLLPSKVKSGHFWTGDDSRPGTHSWDRSSTSLLRAEREDEMGKTPKEIQAQRRAKLEDPSMSWAVSTGDDLTRMPNYWPARQALVEKYPGLDPWYGLNYDGEIDEEAMRWLRPEAVRAIRNLAKKWNVDSAVSREAGELQHHIRSDDFSFPEETGAEEGGE